MALVTLPFTFAPQTVIASAQVNQNFSALVAGFANIDTTNIGAAGISAAKVIGNVSPNAPGPPLFFSLGQFGFQGSNVTDVPLSVQQVKSTTVPAFQILGFQGGTARFWIDTPQCNVNTEGNFYCYPTAPVEGSFGFAFGYGTVGTGTIATPGSLVGTLAGANPITTTPATLWAIDNGGNTNQLGQPFGVAGTGHMAGPALIVSNTAGTVGGIQGGHAVFGVASVTLTSGAGSTVVTLLAAQAFATTNFAIIANFTGTPQTGTVTGQVSSTSSITLNVTGATGGSCQVAFIAIGA